MQPLVSIITPSFNQGEFIEETIKSVLAQTYRPIEYIVMDGGSVDETKDILSRYSGRLSWVSEKDGGQGDAVNKGFARARGEILGWLNSDDTYEPIAVSTVVRYFQEHPDVVMVYGDAYHMDKKGRVTTQYPTEPFSLKRLWRFSFLCQPAVFIRSEVFREVGPLDISLQVAMDYDYWCRIGLNYGARRIGFLQGVHLANSRLYYEAKTLRLRKSVYREAMLVQKKHFGRIHPKWIFGYFKRFVLRIPYRL